MQLAEQESLRHILSGGYWHPEKDGNFKSAGPLVVDFLSKHPFLQNLLGYGIPGKVSIQAASEFYLGAISCEMIETFS